MSVTSPASLGMLEFDAIIDRTESLESDVPEYITESGYTVSDNVVRKGISLEITAVFSNSPVTWLERHSPSLSRVESMCNELRKLWMDGSVLTFTVGGDTYDNMVIESVTIPRSPETMNMVKIKFKLKQVIITQTEVTTIDIKYARGGASAQNTGAGQSSASAVSSGSEKSSASSDSSNKESVLVSLGRVTGLLK